LLRSTSTLVWQVTMADRSAAERACKDPNPIIDGRKANVNLAYLGAKPRILPGRTLPGYDEYNSRTFSPGHRRRLFILDSLLSRTIRRPWGTS